SFVTARDPVELVDEVHVPRGPSEFAVDGGGQSTLALQLADSADGLVLNRLQLLGRDLAARGSLSGRVQLRRTQKTTDMVSTKWRNRTLAHDPILTRSSDIPQCLPKTWPPNVFPTLGHQPASVDPCGGRPVTQWRHSPTRGGRFRFTVVRTGNPGPCCLQSREEPRRAPREPPHSMRPRTWT